MQNSKLGARSIQPKFWPVRPGKVVHLKRWATFFDTFLVGWNRSIQFWTEISENFGWMDIVPLRYAKGVPFVNRRYMKGVPVYQKWYLNLVMGWTSGQSLPIGWVPQGANLLCKNVREYYFESQGNKLHSELSLFFSLEDLLSYHPKLNAI